MSPVVEAVVGPPGVVVDDVEPFEPGVVESVFSDVLLSVVVVVVVVVVEEVDSSSLLF